MIEIYGIPQNMPISSISHQKVTRSYFDNILISTMRFIKDTNCLTHSVECYYIPPHHPHFPLILCYAVPTGLCLIFWHLDGGGWGMRGRLNVIVSYFPTFFVENP